MKLQQQDLQEMSKIVIIGAGGFGREVKSLIEDINASKKGVQYEVVGFYDDGIEKGTLIHDLPVLGCVEDLNEITGKLNVVLGIGVPNLKEKIVKSITNKNIVYPTLIHPSVIKSENNIEIGKGSIITAGNILTCDIKLGNFVTLNLSCTVGHDTIIEAFSSFMPSVNISGEVIIHKSVYVGTGAKIINQLEIGENTIIGAGAVVAKSIPGNCTAVGIPAKPIKFH